MGIYLIAPDDHIVENSTKYLFMRINEEYISKERIFAKASKFPCTKIKPLSCKAQAPYPLRSIVV